MRGESNSRLKYIHHNTSDIKNLKTSEDKTIRQVHHHEIPEKLEAGQYENPSSSKMHSSYRSVVNSNRPSCSKHQTQSDEKVLKIYERKQHPDLPEIRIINEKQTKEKIKKSITTTKHRKSETFASKASSTLKEELRSKMETFSKNGISEEGKKSSERFSLFQISNVQSAASSDFFSLPRITRSFSSSPDLHKISDS